jgi:hypothetical protein
MSDTPRAMQSIGRLEQQKPGAGQESQQTPINSIDLILTAQQDANEQIV